MPNTGLPGEHTLRPLAHCADDDDDDGDGDNDDLSVHDDSCCQRAR